MSGAVLGSGDPAVGKVGLDMLPEYPHSLRCGREAPRTWGQWAGEGHWSLMKWGSGKDEVELSGQTRSEGKGISKPREWCVLSTKA